MFTAASFIIVQNYEQPRCPSTGKRINNTWAIYTIKYYSVIKINQLSRHKITSMYIVK